VELIHVQDKYPTQFSRDLITTAASTLLTAVFYTERINLSGNVRIVEYFLVAFLPFIWLLILFTRGAFDKRRLLTQPSTYINIIVAGIESFLIIATANYVLHFALSRVFIFVSVLALVATALLNRVTSTLFLASSKNPVVRKTFFVGTRSDFAQVKVRVEATFSPYSEIALLPTDVKKSVDHLIKELAKYSATERIVAIVFPRNATLSAEYLAAIRHRKDLSNITFMIPNPTYGLVGISDFAPSGDFLSLSPLRKDAAGNFFKRIFDITFSMLAIIFSLPFLIIAAVLVKTTSRGKIFYISERIGLDEKKIRFPKFRTMYSGSDEFRGEVLGSSDGDIAEKYKIDPRITPIGRILRRWSIDEFPQFLSVLAGSMSIVGPRPILQEELALIPKEALYRFTVKPGLTGLWQTKGRKLVLWEERMALDMQYVERWSLSNDIVLILRTIGSIIRGDGAY
jgi:lipopolysaccharide/colanic/teichoic acid biosynthesis glycosyltransferase